jgi:hypothetical protein
MVFGRAVMTLAVLALGGCAVHMPSLSMAEKPEVVVGDPQVFCPKANPCSKVANRRQYFDQRANRYYYFDQTLGRYFWENGQPRFQGTEPANPDDAPAPAKES